MATCKTTHRNDCWITRSAREGDPEDKDTLSETWLIKLPLLALASQLDRRMFIYNFIQGKVPDFSTSDKGTKGRLTSRVNINGIRFSERKCYNTSWHRYIRLLGSLTLHSETAVENFMASQAPQTSSEESE
ncbi:unnamed protein product, partial [Porites lobata]